MKLSTTRRIGNEQFPGEPRKWLPSLLDPVNSFFEQVYYALTNGLTLRDNFKAQVHSTAIPAGSSSVKFKLNINERPTEVRVAHIQPHQTSGAMAAWSMNWQLSQGTVEVFFTGLDSNTKYNITLIAQV